MINVCMVLGQENLAQDLTTNIHTFETFKADLNNLPNPL